MIKKTADINNFIGVYDNYITKQNCNEAIKLFNKQNKFKKTIDRQNFENASVIEKKDTQFFATEDNIEIWWDELKLTIVNFELALKNYIKNTGVDEAYKSPFHYTRLKIQRTLPSEGYHNWHIEHGKGFDLEHRVLVFSIYLNDVDEGGETEFLHFSKRIKPKTGRIVIWPAAFPYVHRGNPPLSGEKYILTSWMNLR